MADLVEAGRLLKELQARRRELTSREEEWRELDAHARRLGEGLAQPVQDRAALDQARELVSALLAASRLREQELRGSSECLHAEARDLLAAGGPFEPDLLRLKDQLSADLFAASFEDVGLEEDWW